MRRPIWFTAALLVTSASTMSHVAVAQCPGDDGTIPGTSASVTTISTPAATLYVDDRDFLDLDEDDDAGGLWIYKESNEEAGLQRGGEWHIELPRPVLGPIPIDVDGDGKPEITLFPNGFGGGCQSSQCESIRAYDECRESAAPDMLVF